MKQQVINHPKTKRLKRRLGKQLYQVVGILECIWNMAGDYADDGVIGRYENEDIANHCEWDGDPDELVNALLETGWLDMDDSQRVVIHDWLDHCPDFISKRIQRRTPADNGGQRRTTADNGRQGSPPADNGSLSRQVQASPGKTKSIPGPGQSRPSPGQSKGENPVDPMDRKCVSAEEIDIDAQTIFDTCGYSGKQGGNLWGAAALLKLDLVTHGEVMSAARGVALKKPKDKPAYFYTCLRNELKKRDEDLTKLLQGVNIKPEWPSERPELFEVSGGGS